ncbi:hypothetical protein BaRGS_00036151 [Batillaria attramentaria]|uniref:Uncharacterized protein n=1 Tax=Batillaria attramentaria TaxID=370345 RepID=A0ABD0JDU8_9CAEN
MKQTGDGVTRDTVDCCDCRESPVTSKWLVTCTTSRTPPKGAMCKLQEHFEKSAEQFEGQMNNYNSGIDALKRIENIARMPMAGERRRQLRDQLTATEKENLMYQSVVQQIRTVLGDEELNEIIDTFIELVEENYMLFKNVAEYRGRVRDAKLLRAEDIERKIEHADSIIQSYITGVLIILYNLDYTESEIKELAGVLGKVEERNVLQFLGEIERNINKLVGIQDYVEFTEYFRRKARSPINGSYLPRHSRQRPGRVQPSWCQRCMMETRDDHLPADADRRPFNREEILDYVLTDVETQEALASREAVRDVRPTHIRRRQRHYRG